MTTEIKANIALVVSVAALLWTIARDLFFFLRDRGTLKFDPRIDIFDKNAHGYTPAKAKKNSELSVIVGNVGKRPVILRMFNFYRKSWFSYHDLGGMMPNPEKEDGYLSATLNDGEQKTYSISLGYAYPLPLMKNSPVVLMKNGRVAFDIDLLFD